jgi:hypothetical protein
MLSYFLDETTYSTTFKEFRFDNIIENDLKDNYYRLLLFENGKILNIYKEADKYEIYDYRNKRLLTKEELLQFKKRVAVFNNGLEINLIR